jgi:site-specific recombinase XerC
MSVRVPVVLSRDEVARIMKHLDGVTWIMVALLYGAGLRLQECLELLVKDIDLELPRAANACPGRAWKWPPVPRSAHQHVHPRRVSVGEPDCGGATQV